MSMPVSIRLARTGDAKAFVESWNESFRMGHLRYTGTQQRNKEDIKNFEERSSENRRNQFAFVAVENHKIVGSCGFSGSARGRTRHRGELGWFVHPDHVGKGIATKLVAAVLREARRRDFKRVEAEIVVENAASVRLAKKFRFRLEGRRKAGIVLDDGRYTDTLIFGKLLR